MRRAAPRAPGGATSARVAATRGCSKHRAFTLLLSITWGLSCKYGRGAGTEEPGSRRGETREGLPADGRRRVVRSVGREDHALALADVEIADAVGDVLQPHSGTADLFDLDLLAVGDDVAAEREHGWAARVEAGHDER